MTYQEKVPAPEDMLVFLPLGGSNEIGMNFNAYGYGPEGDRRWLIVDCGVTFASEEKVGGFDLIVPDVRWFEERRDRIDAIILTHGHEDHIGALAHLWPMLKAPLYATPFTANLIAEKLREKGLFGKVPLNIVKLGAKFAVGDFGIEYLTLTHSIAEPNGLVITTPLGTVFHTGDWKIDPDPQVGETTDIKRLKELGDAGVLAMVCDSTNVFVEGESGSEASVKTALAEVMAEQKGRVVVACFASNVARLQSACDVSAQLGRSVCLLGRSMLRITAAARSVGLLGHVNFVEPEAAMALPPHKVTFLATGSQGEPRAALARIAAGNHPSIRLKAGDSVLFSSREIPGNEKAIFALQDQLVDAGIKIITAHERPIHVSGHPCRDELAQMYGWVRPEIAIPTHGERRHLVEHEKFAQGLQVPQTYAPHNGDMVRLAPGPVALIDEVPSGRMFVDGEALIASDSPALLDRERLGSHGSVFVVLCVDGKGKIVAGPDVRARGLSEKDGSQAEAGLETLADVAEAAFGRLKGADRTDEDVAEDVIMRAVRKACRQQYGKNPIVDVVVMAI